MPDAPSPKPKRPMVGALLTATFVASGLLLLTFRVDVPTDKVLIATYLSGKDLPEGEFVALDPGSKGVLLKPYNEGYHWFNPYFYRTELVPATIIKSGDVGILCRLFGKDLPADRILATPNYDEEVGTAEVFKGIIEKPLQPGKYNINTRAYHVETYLAMKVPPGYVGVAIRLADPMGPPNKSLVYTSQGPEFKGVSPIIRQPGTYYLNPYTELLVLYDVRQQRFDFTQDENKDNSLDFQSSDAFTLNMEGTVEWSLVAERAPDILCRLGNFDLKTMRWPWESANPLPGKKGAPDAGEGTRIASLKDIQDTVLVPYTRSYLRILGAKYKASEYISGERRMEIQKEFQQQLTERCAQFGVSIANVSIRRINPPSIVKQIINDRSQQQEKRIKILQDIEKIRSDATLAEKRESIRKGQRMVETRTLAEKERIRAKQERNEKVTEAESELVVAAINRQKAETEKSVVTIQERGKIDQQYRLEKAKIEAFALEIEATGGGGNHIRSLYFRKLGTGLAGVVTSDDSPFMEVFREVFKLSARPEGHHAAPKPNEPAAPTPPKEGSK